MHTQKRKLKMYIYEYPNPSIRFTVSEQLKEFIEKKLLKLETFYDKIIDADVYLKLESHQQVKEKTSEIKLNVPGVTLFSSETAKNFEAATDLTVESLRRQLKKYKEKNM